MNLVLKRTQFCEDGVFGRLLNEDDSDGLFTMATLEHAFQPAPGAFRAKVPAGKYTCRRGVHTLHSIPQGFETFEVVGVPHFEGNPVTGILFHMGNHQSDSEGCILVGVLRTGNMVMDSRVAFASFMSRQMGVDEFMLTVLDA